MKNIKNFLYRYKHGIVFLYLPIYFVWFTILESHVTSNYHIVHMALDDYIPFLEIFIIPYLLWFGYISVVVLYFFFTNVHDFYKVCAFLFTGMTIFLIVSTLFPNGQQLRPLFFERDNIFCQLVRLIYRADTNTNVFPSIHVFNSVAAHLAVSRSEALKKKPWIQNGSLILSISIILSTMFIKQHSVCDVLGAFALAAVVYVFVYGVEPLKNRRSLQERSTKEQFRRV